MAATMPLVVCSRVGEYGTSLSAVVFELEPAQEASFIRPHGWVRVFFLRHLFAFVALGICSSVIPWHRSGKLT